MAPARDALPLFLATTLAAAAALGSSPEARHVLVATDTATLIGVVNQVGAAMAEGMPVPDVTDAPRPALIPPVLPLVHPPDWR